MNDITDAESRPELDTERVRLRNGAWPEGRESTLALLFGEMVKRATPILDAYHSDLYRDATWLREKVQGSTVFTYGIRATGTTTTCTTHIAERISSTALDSRLGMNNVVYTVALTCERDNTWYATFTRHSYPH